METKYFTHDGEHGEMKGKRILDKIINQIISSTGMAAFIIISLLFLPTSSISETMGLIFCFAHIVSYT